MLASQIFNVAYGQSEVLHGLNVAVAPNEIVAIMGRNGMGKTNADEVADGNPARQERLGDHGRCGARRIAELRTRRQGLAYVPQGRMIFSTMTVKENIETGLVVSGESEVPAASTNCFRCSWK